MLATSGARPVDQSVSSIMSNYRRMYPGAGVIVHDAMAWREGSCADVLKQTRVINGYQRQFSFNHSQTTTTIIMSAAQRVQQHPIFVQVQNKAQYYNAQLDKEVSHSILSHDHPSHFFHSSQSTPSSTPSNSAHRSQRPTLSSVASSLSSSFTLSMPLPLPFQTSWVGVCPRTSPSRPSKHHRPTMTSNGSPTG